MQKGHVTTKIMQSGLGGTLTHPTYVKCIYSLLNWTSLCQALTQARACSRGGTPFAILTLDIFFTVICFLPSEFPLMSIISCQSQTTEPVTEMTFPLRPGNANWQHVVGTFMPAQGLPVMGAQLGEMEILVILLIFSSCLARGRSCGCSCNTALILAWVRGKSHPIRTTLWSRCRWLWLWLSVVTISMWEGGGHTHQLCGTCRPLHFSASFPYLQKWMGELLSAL